MEEGATPYFIVLSVKQGGIKYHFWVFGITLPGIELQSPGPLANTLLIRPMMSEYKCIAYMDSLNPSAKGRMWHEVTF